MTTTPPTITDHVVMLSGGVGSWATARAAQWMNPDGNFTLLFADTLMEDEDLYRFLDDIEPDIGPITRIQDGRDPWEVFFDVKFLGNSMIDPCSLHLKRKLLRNYIDERFDPDSTTVYLGIDWTEEHRFVDAQRYWEPWKTVAPLITPFTREKDWWLGALEKRGIAPPRLYEMGFAHNNCGGFCIKAGQGQFAHLLKTMPSRYLYHEGRELELRAYLGKNVAILRDRRGGRTRPMTLREFRHRCMRKDPTLDLTEWGGCACFTPSIPLEQEVKVT